jgi:WD40 repeat protein
LKIDGVRDVAFSPDGTRIACSSINKTAHVWDATTGAELTVLKGHEGPLNRLAFSPDGSRIVTTSHDKTARLWDVVPGVGDVGPHGHENQVTSVAFSRDGARVVTGSLDTTARIWDAATGAELAVMRGHSAAVSNAVFSGDNARILTASYDRTARIWDAATGAELAVFGTGTPGLVSVFNYGENIELTLHATSVKVFNLGEGGFTFQPSTSPRMTAAFFPDGAHVVTGSDDRTARIWDAARRIEIARIFLDAEVTALAVHCNTIALGDGLGRIHVIDAPS